MDGWMDGCMGGQMHGWVHGRASMHHICVCLYHREYKAKQSSVKIINSI